MWISRKEYKFLKENAEKNIDKEYEILNVKNDMKRAFGRAMEEYSYTLSECDKLKNRVNELTKIIDGQKTNDNKIYVIVVHNYTLGDFVLSTPVAYAIDESNADKWISDQKVKTYRGNDGKWYPYYTKEKINIV